MYFSKKVGVLPQYHGYNVARMSVVWSLTGAVTDTTLYMFHTVNGCIMRVYWFYSLLSFSVVHSPSFFLAFITVAVVCVMDLVVWNKRGLDWIGLDYQNRTLFAKVMLK